MSRLFRTYEPLITQNYKGSAHCGVDLVGRGPNNSMCLDYITAHSDGTVVKVVSDYVTTDSTGSSYGNHVYLRHPNGMYTLYAHMKYGSVDVVPGQTVKAGDIIGYMGNTGHSCGAHLHFEVRDIYQKCIDPSPYLEADLPDMDVSGPSTYTVVKGDNLTKIARKFNTSVKVLLSLNPQIKNKNLIYPGQIITLP